MQALTLLMFVAVIIVDFLAQGDRFGEWRFLPGSASYIVELLSAVALVYVILVGSRDRFGRVRPVYWALFGSLLLIVVCGVIANAVDSGPVIAGLRTYLRALPWFFIPLVYRYSDEQLRVQFKLLLALFLLQLPIAIRQRMNTADNSYGFVAVTGDWTTGTLGDSGILSIVLVCVASVIAALHQRQLLSLPRMLVLFMLVLVPTMINETKAMVAFLPLALLVAFWHAAPAEARLRRMGVGIAMLAIFGLAFVPAYNALNKDREYGSTLLEFFSKRESVEAYLSSSSEIGTVTEAGRVDALVVPLRRLSQDPVSLMFGYGIGNASDSSLGSAFSGRYAVTFRPFLQTAMSKFGLEIGMLGCGLLLAVLWVIFLDARNVARYGVGLRGALAAGWTGVVALTVLAAFYSKIEVFPSMGFLFWYFSGIVAAERAQLILDGRQ
jgi:hypothetical protein